MRILIADDHPVVRQGVRQIIESEPGFSVAAEATNGDEAMTLAREVDWDLAVLDYAMPGRCGLDLVGDFRREFPDRAVLVLSMHEEDVHAAAVLGAGGSGWVSKESAPRELTTAIKRVAAGGRYVSEGLAETLAAGLNSDLNRPPHEKLSDREYRVMWLLASGSAINDIARDLQLHPSTVSTYRSRVLSKLGLATNADLVRYAIRQQLIG
jgi:two-component system invasion response regulator UvrY